MVQDKSLDRLFKKYLIRVVEDVSPLFIRLIIALYLIDIIVPLIFSQPISFNHFLNFTITISVCSLVLAFTLRKWDDFLDERAEENRQVYEKARELGLSDEAITLIDNFVNSLSDGEVKILNKHLSDELQNYKG